MPNHVTNILKISGPKKDVTTVQAMLAGVDEEGAAVLIDFNRVIPMPKGVDWYQWSIKHWGTKWNAYRAKRLKSNTIQFETAWSIPLPVYARLGQLFPKLTFEITFADEDLGRNCGRFQIKGRVMVDLISFEQDYSRDAVKFAAKVTGAKLTAAELKEYAK